MEFFRQLLTGIAQAWRRLSASARINILLAGMATILLVLGVIYFGGRPQLVTLYSQLNTKDASAIQSYLEDQDVPYRVTDGGQTVLVPAKERSRLRVALMEQSLPASQGAAPGFELFDRQDLMANRFLQDVNYRRAVQGELQRQLNEFDFVNASWVSIQEAKESVFAEEQKPSEAAVTLDVKRPLTPRETKGIVHLVSSFGGANLSPQNVTLVTTDGKLLHSPPEDEFASVANSKLEYIHALESEREEKVRRALADAGVRAIVKVSAEVDFTSIKETENTVIEGIPISSMSTSTTTTSRQALPEGPAGATANLPEGVAGTGATTEESSEETIENFEPSTRSVERVIEPGAVKRYKVSALLESKYREDPQSHERTPVPLTDEEKERYSQFIAAAVGVDVAAGDITIFDQPFELAQLAPVPGAPSVEGETVQSVLVQLAKEGWKWILVVVGFFWVRSLLRRAMSAPVRPEEELPEAPPMSSEELRKRQITTEIEHATQEQPEGVAALLRTWMSEPEE
ncbi:MAG: flagellar M-ring protein FliF [Candidatus Hydrogenedentes bacterium]|nr:flagellar M-ring protein FliF [Candidatus Hydrogenedentota bacterium]